MSGVFEKRYFCAANSGEGFVSFYSELIAAADRVFVIKGGPGTGKSRFLREVGSIAEKYGHDTVYYYCSSDSDSLDALILDGRILLLDGTAPHAVEASVPGSRDDIINLGGFWDSALLIGQRRPILRLNAKKAACFDRAYRYLSATAETVRAAETLVLPAVLTEKLAGAAYRSLKSLPNGDGYSERSVLLESFGMRGQVRFDTLRQSASEYYTVSDTCGTAHLFFAALLEAAKQKGLAVTLSRNPLFPDRLDALRLDDSGRVYEIGSDGEKHINMRRFLDYSDIKAASPELRLAFALRDSLLDAAICTLKTAAEYHFALEKIYGAAMDFAAKEEFTENFIGELFDL